MAGSPCSYLLAFQAYEWKILNQLCCVVFIIQLYVYSTLFFSYNRHKVIEKKIKLQISLIKHLSLVYWVLVTNHRVEFFEPIFFLKFVTFLPLTFVKTFLGPWELLPLIIYIPPSPNIFYTSNVVWHNNTTTWFSILCSHIN